MVARPVMGLDILQAWKRVSSSWEGMEEMHFDVMCPWSRMLIETEGEPRDAMMEEGVLEGDCEEMREMREGKISMLWF
jgi:hypothetical protein